MHTCTMHTEGFKDEQELDTVQQSTDLQNIN